MQLLSCADEEVELPAALALGGPKEREAWAERRARARAGRSARVSTLQSAHCVVQLPLVISSLASPS